MYELYADLNFNIIILQVRFISKPKIHILCTWYFAYHSARKAHWDIYARDQFRFNDRINRLSPGWLYLPAKKNSENQIQKIKIQKFKIQKYKIQKIHNTETRNPEIARKIQNSLRQRVLDLIYHPYINQRNG